MALYAPLQMTFTRSGSPTWSPPTIMSSAMRSTLSSMPSLRWNQLPGTAMAPPDRMVSPPVMPNFSSSTTFLPASATVSAAA